MSISRRKFLGSSASAVLVAGTMAKGKVFGANERVQVCCMGIHGRGGEHIKQFSELKDSQVVALCDVDQDVLDSHASAVQKMTEKKPKKYTDIRDALEQKSIDVISIATPNHWHSLAAVWGVQAGKDVYVEKPISHGIWEGRQLVNAVAKTGRIVQHGTQSRSDARWMRDMRLLHEGSVIGKVHMAKGYTYKTGNRHSIGFADPEAPPKNLNWTLWQGPAQEREYCKNYVHYNWHWFWEYGNGETGNQGVHEMDLSVWGLNRGYPVKVYSSGGRHVWNDQGETPNVQTSTFTYADNSTLVFEIRNTGSWDEGGSDTAAHFLAADGYYLEGKGFFDYKHSPIEVKDPMPETAGAFGNFIKAVKSRKQEDIPATALQGHISAAHCHLGNIAYRLGRSLEWDGATERFVNDEQANAMLKRDYRPGFEVPEVTA